MKIAMIVPSLHMGGGEKFAIELANELSKNKNNSVTLCILSKITKEMMLFNMIDSRVKTVSLEKENGFDIKIIFKLKEFLNNEQFDIVHTHLRAMLYTTWSIFSIRRTQYIHTFHTLIEQEVPNKGYNILLKILFKYFNVTPIAISKKVLEGMQTSFGKNQKNIILNGVSPVKTTPSLEDVKEEIASYKKANNSKVFLSVSRVTKVKNQKLLINTFSQLKNNDILIIVGSLSNEYEYAKECQQMAKEMDNIFFLGEKSNVGDYLHCSDALCLSSLFEGLPLVILEAMSIGKIVLATKVGGIPDVVIDGLTGYLAEDMSVEKYLIIINKLNKSSSIDTSFILSKFQKHHSIEICANSYYDVYKNKNKKSKV